MSRGDLQRRPGDEEPAGLLTEPALELAFQRGEPLWGLDYGEFELFATDTARFFLKAADYGLTFVPGPDGAAARIDLDTGGRTIALVREGTAPCGPRAPIVSARAAPPLTGGERDPQPYPVAPLSRRSSALATGLQ